jgi:hypothetical protein
MRSDYDGEGDEYGGDDLEDDFVADDENLEAEDWDGEEEIEGDNSEEEMDTPKKSHSVPMNMDEYNKFTENMNLAKEKTFLFSLSSSKRPYTQITPFLRVLISRLRQEIEGRLLANSSHQSLTVLVNGDEKVKLYANALVSFAVSYTLPLANVIKEELKNIQNHVTTKRLFPSCTF